MQETSQKTQSSDRDAIELANIADQLRTILVQLDRIEGVEVVALRVDEAINAMNGICSANSSLN